MIKVVIIEDDKMVASINREFVNQLHDFHVVGCFHDSLEALGYLLHHDVDLVLLDIYMDHYSGMDLLREMRQKQINADVIMITVANEVEYINEAMKLGIIDYLIKPFQFERLKQSLHHYLQQKEMLNQSSLTQQDIDKLLSLRHQNENDIPLSKGIQEETLETIKNILSKSPNTFKSVESIAKETGFSKVTIRRYLNYLCEKGIAMSHMNYTTGGRPSLEYMIVYKKK